MKFIFKIPKYNKQPKNSLYFLYILQAEIESIIYNVEKDINQKEGWTDKGEWKIYD